MALENKYSLILASQSPRRKELLGWIDVPFEIIPSQVEEHSDSSDPIQFALDIAALKGNDIWSKLEERISSSQNFFPLIIASDTVVELDGVKYGKPVDRADAKRMLLELSGRTHQVVTSVFLKRRDIKSKEELVHSFAVKTQVTFNKIGDDILEPYLDSRESMDKAGSYGIQGKGLTFVSDLKGSYSNVVGFPLVEFLDELKRFLGLEETNDWRNSFV